MRRALALVALLIASTACGGPQKAPAHVVRGCSPLAPAGTCLLPFPDSWFEQADAKSDTGRRVIFPDGTLPANTKGVLLREAAFGTLDGYSPATPIIVWFPQGVDRSALPSLADSARTAQAGFPIALVDLTTDKRVAFFAELDLNADPAQGEKQALLIHPLSRLENDTRYAVAITTALHDAQGKPLAPSGAFAQWVQGSLPSSSPLAEISDRLDQDQTAFQKLGIAKKDLALAFDFDTASDAQATGRLVAMRDQALAAAPHGLGYTIDSKTEPTPDADPDALRIIDGHFLAPNFEVGKDPSLLDLDRNGNPVMTRAQPFPFTAVIPRCVQNASGPVPLLILGHGLFDTAHSELMDDRNLLNQLCMVAIGTDWLGVAQYDFTTIASKVLPDVNDFGLITDRLLQAHVNFQVLTRLAMNALASDPAFAVDGRPSYDPSRRYYWGASNGGIQGTTYLALSPDIERGVLNVPGAEWSTMIWRSSDFGAALLVLDQYYPDKLDQQLLVALSQSLWDRSDPIEFSPHLAHPLPGVPMKKEAIFQESLGDAQVPNLATDIEMRTIGAVGLAPLSQPVFGISSGSPTGGIVYTQWNVYPTPLPPSGDVPAANNPAHDAVRRLPQAIAQTADFLEPDGKVVQTCGSGEGSDFVPGPCTFPPGN